VVRGTVRGVFADRSKEGNAYSEGTEIVWRCSLFIFYKCSERDRKKNSLRHGLGFVRTADNLNLLQKGLNTGFIIKLQIEYCSQPY
jgi:hypothetical protein